MPIKASSEWPQTLTTGEAARSSGIYVGESCPECQIYLVSSGEVSFVLHGLDIHPSHDYPEVVWRVAGPGTTLKIANSQHHAGEKL